MKRLIVLLFVISQAAAQVPGYMGKRLSVGYRAEVSPRLIDVFYEFGEPVSYNGNNVEWYALATTHNLDLEWVILPQRSLRFMYGTSNNGAFSYDFPNYSSGNEPKFMRDEFKKLSSYYDVNEMNIAINGNDVRDYDYIRISSTMLKYGLTSSDGFYLSPHGKTTSIYFLQNITEVEYVLNTTAKPYTRVSSYGLMGERSYRKIIADAVILEYGVCIGYLFGSRFSEVYIAPTAAEYFTSLDTKRILFQFSIGIRYLVPKKKK